MASLSTTPIYHIQLELPNNINLTNTNIIPLKINHITLCTINLPEPILEPNNNILQVIK